MDSDSHGGARLREQRDKQGLTQSEAAARCGVSREMWGKYERGIAVPGGTVLTAMRQLGIDIDYILTGTPAKLRDALSQVRASSEIAGRYGKTDAEKAALQADIFNALRAAQPSAEDQALLEHYHSADVAVRPAILAAAASLAAAAPHAQSPPLKPAPRTRKPKS